MFWVGGSCFVSPYFTRCATSLNLILRYVQSVINFSHVIKTIVTATRLPVCQNKPQTRLDHDQVVCILFYGHRAIEFESWQWLFGFFIFLRSVYYVKFSHFELSQKISQQQLRVDIPSQFFTSTIRVKNVLRVTAEKC